MSEVDEEAYLEAKETDSEAEAVVECIHLTVVYNKHYTDNILNRKNMKIEFGY
jgi:hypothetical protein